jgi:uncharacterized protein YjbI with pentapeptide repeats
MFTDNINEQIDTMRKSDIAKEQIKEYQKKYPNINMKEKFDLEINKIQNSKEIKAIEENGFESILTKCWSDAARYFIGDMNQNLKKNNKKYNELIKFGLREMTINHILYIGINDTKRVIPKKEWISNEKDIEIDTGFVIPHFKDNEVKKIAIRKKLFDINGKYLSDENDIYINGSEDEELILKGLKDEYILIVDEILQGYLLFQDLWQICTIFVKKDKKEFENSEYFNKNKGKIEFIFTTKFDLKYKNIKTYNLNIKDNIYEESLKKRDFELEILNKLPENKYNTIMKKECKKKKKLGSSYIGFFNLKNQENRINKHYLDNFTKLKSNKDLMSILDEKSKHTLLNSIDNLNIQNIKNTKPTDQDEIFNKINKCLNDAYKKNPSKTLKKEIKKMVSNLETLKMTRSKEQKQDIIPESMKKEFKKSFNRDLDKEEQVFYSQKDIMKYYKDSLDFSNSLFQIDELKNVTFINCNFNASTWNSCNLENIKFENCTFEQSSFTSCIFDKTTFQSSIMDNISILSSEISNCNFFKTNLNNLTLNTTEVKLTTFDSCEMEKAIFNDTDIYESDFLSIDFSEGLISSSAIKQCKFENSNLMYLLYTSTKIDNTIYTNSDLYKSTFMQTTLNNCDLSGIKANNIYLSKETKLKNIDFKKSDLDNSYFQEIKCINIDFSYASIQNAIIQKCILQNCNMSYLNAKETSFEKSEFDNCQIVKLNLLKGNLRKASLIKSSFYNSNLFECNIFNTKFNDSIFKDCNLNNTNLENNKERFINEN